MKSASRFTRQLRRSDVHSRRRLLLESLESRQLLTGQVFPNDPQFPDRWFLHNTGQYGTPDADIDAPEAWSVTTGSMKTVVAIVDVGVDYTHPDLYLNIWLNQAEIPAAVVGDLADFDSDGIITFRDLNVPANASYVTDLNANGYIDGGDLLADPLWENGLDEDGNGRTDDLVGWDFRDDDNDPWADAFAHGTDNSLFIGAIGNNGLGAAGVVWSVQLMPLRIDALNYLTISSAMDYSVASGAPIAYSGYRSNPPDGALPASEFSQVVYDAIDRARQAGQLVVTGAGNGSRDSDVNPWYPGAYNLDNVINAAAVDQNNQLASISNWGATSVDIGVSALNGTTSKALAMTTGVAALLKSAHPDWTYSQIKERIMSSVDPLLSLAGKTVTGGRLNAANALGYVPPATKFYIADDGSANRTFEYDASGAAIENYAVNSGNVAPRGAASTVAGDKVWVVDNNRKVFVYDTAGGLLGSWTAGTLPSNADIQGVTTNGADVWIVDAKQDKVFKYSGAASRLSGSQNAASSFNLNSSNSSPTDLVTDGTNLWVLNATLLTDKVFKYTLSGTLLGSWTISGAGTSPTGITLDPSSPSHLWIVDNGTDRVYQFDAAVSRTSGSQSPSTSFALAAGNTNPQGIADPPAGDGSGSAYDAALLSLLSDLDHSVLKKKRP